MSAPRSAERRTGLSRPVRKQLIYLRVNCSAFTWWEDTRYSVAASLFCCERLVAGGKPRTSAHPHFSTNAPETTTTYDTRATRWRPNCPKWPPACPHLQPVYETVGKSGFYWKVKQYKSAKCNFNICLKIAFFRQCF